MATPVQRAQSILDALKDASVGQTVSTRVIDAFTHMYAQFLPQTPTPVTPETATNAQKATLFVQVMRTFVKETVQAYEANQAAEAARQAAIAAAASEVDLGSA